MVKVTYPHAILAGKGQKKGKDVQAGTVIAEVHLAKSGRWFVALAQAACVCVGRGGGMAKVATITD